MKQSFTETTPERSRKKKTRLCITTAFLICVGYLLCSCTPTTTWHQIRSDPDRYGAETEVSIKGEVSGEYWDWSNETGWVFLKDCNGDTGRIDFPKGETFPEIGDVIAAKGTVQLVQNDVGSEARLLLDDYGQRFNHKYAREVASERFEEFVGAFVDGVPIALAVCSEGGGMPWRLRFRLIPFGVGTEQTIHTAFGDDTF